MELRSVLQNITPFIADRSSLKYASSDWYRELSRNDKEILNVLLSKYHEEHLLDSVVRAIQADDINIIEQLLHEYTGYLPFSWYDLYSIAESDRMKQLFKAYKPPYKHPYRPYSSVLTPLSIFEISGTKNLNSDVRDIILYDDWNAYQRNKEFIVSIVRADPIYLKNAYNHVVQDLMRDPNILYSRQNRKEDASPDQLEFAMQMYLNLHNKPDNRVLLTHIFPRNPAYEQILSDLLDRYFNRYNAIDLIVNIIELGYGYNKVKQLTKHTNWFEYYMNDDSTLQDKPKKMDPDFWKKLLTSAVLIGSYALAVNIIEKEDVSHMSPDIKNRLKKFIKKRYPIDSGNDRFKQEQLIKAVDGESYRK